MSIFPARILVATDGSEEAQLAATTAADLAEKTNSELHLVTVGPDYEAVSIEPTRLAICDRLSRPQVLLS
jgi:nucleotide-binding universal stress UspA family protein